MIDKNQVLDLLRNSSFGIFGFVGGLCGALEGQTVWKTCVCPIGNHQGFRVSVDTGSWKCAVCGHGDIFELVRRLLETKLGIPRRFPDALAFVVKTLEGNGVAIPDELSSEVEKHRSGPTSGPPNPRSQKLKSKYEAAERRSIPSAPKFREDLPTMILRALVERPRSTRELWSIIKRNRMDVLAALKGLESEGFIRREAHADRRGVVQRHGLWTYCA